MIRRNPSRARSVASIVGAPRRPPPKVSLPSSTAREPFLRIRGLPPGGSSATSRRIALAPRSRTATGRLGAETAVLRRSPSGVVTGMSPDRNTILTAPCSGSREARGDRARGGAGGRGRMIARDKRRGRVRPPGDKPVTAPSARDDRSSLLLEDRITRVFRELPGAVAGQEEPVHQVRVAGRRLRVALPLLARKGEGRTVSKSVRVLRRLTRSVGAG